MKLSDILLEMPNIIGAYSPDMLIDSKFNRRKYNQLMVNTHKKLYKNLNDYANIYILGRKIFCLDTKRQMITYYMEYKTDYSNLIGHYVKQITVWAADELTYIINIPNTMFWDYLVEKYHNVITDNQQSWEGKSFWLRQIRSALVSPSIYVYYVDFGNREVYEIKDEIEWDIFTDKGIVVWDRGKKYEMRRIMISDKQLQLK